MIEVPEILKYALNTLTSVLNVIVSSHFWALFLFLLVANNYVDYETLWDSEDRGLLYISLSEIQFRHTICTCVNLV